MSKAEVQATAQKRVLVVEDDEAILRSLQQLLEDAGYEVSLATNGREALKRLRSADVQPQLILLDLMMPVMNGLEFCLEKQRDSDLKDIAVVVMSANRHMEDQFPPGLAKAWLKKPVRISTIIEMAKRYCA